MQRRVFVLVALCSCGPTEDEGGDDGRLDCAMDCLAGEVCRFGECVEPPPACAADADCRGDTYCDEANAECLPFGVGPGGGNDDRCLHDTTPGVFFPSVQCEWLGPPPGDPYPEHRNVLSSPVVVDFGGNDPEDRRPGIAFISYNFSDGGADACVGTMPGHTGVIRVIDGRTCAQRASIADPLPIPSSSLAVADLDGLPGPEIVAARAGGGLAAWTTDGAGGFRLLWQTASTFGAGECVWAGPSIHDLDDDGLAEIIHFGAVFDHLGNLLTEGPPMGGGTGYVPVVADVDADGVPELVTGAAVYGWQAATHAWALEAMHGLLAQTAVADLGTYGADPAADDRATLDGIAEVVAVAGGMIRVHTLAGRTVFSTPIPGGGLGGAPTIADFDGDGRAEFASAGAAAYSVYDLDCLGTPDPATCATLTGDGVLWSRPSQDASSNVTGSSVFDFEGDGRAEAVYADECFTRVYDGRSGTVMYSRYRTSCTWYEQPVIADVDADYNAEILIPSNTNCGITCPTVDPLFDGVSCLDEADCPSTTACLREAPGDPLGRCRCAADTDCGGDGFVCLDPVAGPSAAGKVCRAQHPGPSTAFGLRVISDGLDRWVNTRTVWNQHAYSVTNIDEDGQVPRTSLWARNWITPGLNNFRQNSPGDLVGAGLSPDLTVRSARYECAGSGSAEVTMEVCNRGTEPVADGLAVTVYAGAVGSAAPSCTAATPRDLFPGVCLEVSCTISGLGSMVDATVVVDDPGTGQGANTECREANNELKLTAIACP